MPKQKISQAVLFKIPEYPFRQALAAALGIRQLPKSPTFALAKSYAVPDTEWTLWHLDCYRLTDHRDLVTIDAHRIFEDPGAIVLVEWAGRVRDALPRDTIEIRFRHAGEDKREITLPS